MLPVLHQQGSRIVSQRCQRQHIKEKVFRNQAELSPIVCSAGSRNRKVIPPPPVASFMRVSTAAERCISNRGGGGGGEKDRQMGGRDADGYSFRLPLV